MINPLLRPAAATAGFFWQKCFESEGRDDKAKGEKVFLKSLTKHHCLRHPIGTTKTPSSRWYE